MNLKQLKEYSKLILKEYADNDVGFMNFGGEDGNSNGKQMDNIAVGQTQAYKNDPYITKYERSLPKLCKIVQDLKSGKITCALQCPPDVVNELIILNDVAGPFKNDGAMQILPLGDNIRLTRTGNQFFISLKDKIDKKQQDKEFSDAGLVSDNT